MVRSFDLAQDRLAHQNGVVSLEIWYLPVRAACPELCRREVLKGHTASFSHSLAQREILLQLRVRQVLTEPLSAIRSCSQGGGSVSSSTSLLWTRRRDATQD